MGHRMLVAAIVLVAACEVSSREPRPPRAAAFDALPAPVVAPRMGYKPVGESITGHFEARRGDEVIFRNARALVAFDLEHLSWTPLREFPEGFDVVDTVVLADGRLLVVQRNGIPTTGVIGDGRTPWTPIAVPPMTRERWSLGALPDGRAVAAGGYDGDVLDGIRDTYVYDPHVDRWSTGPSLPERTWRATFAGRTPVIAARGAGLVRDALVLETARWTRVALPVVETGFSTLALADGRLVWIGGTVIDGELVAAPTTILDPRTRTFTQAPALPDRREDPAVVEVAPGIVAAFSGHAGADRHLDLSVAWLDLAGGEWHDGPRLPDDHRAQYVARHGEAVVVFCVEGFDTIRPFAISPAELLGR